MDENKELKQAKEEYDKIMADEHEKMLIRLREKYWLDYNSMKSASFDEGKEAGLKERTKTAEKKNGIKEREKEIARKMLELKLDIEVIMQTTGLTREEIGKLL